MNDVVDGPCVQELSSDTGTAGDRIALELEAMLISLSHGKQRLQGRLQA